MDALNESMAKGIMKKDFSQDVMLLGDNPSPLLVKDVLSTGLPNLDRILCKAEDGRWGIPVGRIMSVKAKPGIGKTTFLLTVANQAFKRGGAVALAESERALDLNYANKICDMDKVLLSQPDTLEEAIDTIEGLVELCLKVRSKEDHSPFLIIVDSFSGFTTSAEASGGGGGLGEHARLASLACRKLTGPLSKAKAILMLTHQTKSKIGVQWGSKETNIGGDAFNFHDSICLSLWRTTAIKKGKEIIGHNGGFKTVKNKLFPPFREVPFRITYGWGFSRSFSIFDFLLNNGYLVKKAAGNYHFKEKKDLKWQGADNFSSFIKENKKARILVKKYLKK